MGGAEQSWILILYEEALLLASNLVRVTEEATYTPRVGNMELSGFSFIPDSRMGHIARDRPYMSLHGCTTLSVATHL